MKLHKLNVKNIVKIFMIIHFISITLSSSNKGIYLKKDTPSFLLYTAEMKIENITKKTKEEITVLIDSYDVKKNTYGFEITLKDQNKKIESPIFFSTSSGKYFLNLRNLNDPLDCSHIQMDKIVLILSYKEDTIRVSFYFTNGWAFSGSNSMESLCSKIKENLNEHSNLFNKSMNELVKSIDSSNELKKERSLNLKTKEDNEKFIEEQIKLKNNLDKEIEDLQNKRELLEQEKDKIYREIKQSNNEINKIKIENKEIQMKKEFLEKLMKNSKMLLKTVNKTVFENKWNHFDNLIKDLIELHDPIDPLRKKFENFSNSNKNIKFKENLDLAKFE